MLILCSILLTLSLAQDAPTWKFISSVKQPEGGDVHYYAKDCVRFTDEESERLPKLCIKFESEYLKHLQGSLDEYDCAKRRFRTRIFFFDSGERFPENPLWEEVVPGSTADLLVEYACRDRSRDKE